MAQHSSFCKAYHAKAFRSFPGWTEKTDSLRKGRKTVDDKETEFDRLKIEDNDVLYLHDCYIVTDGIFKDENIVFDNLTDDWRTFCTEQLKFAIPDYKQKSQALPQSSV